jgi:N6-L-threonylcarbamoyladenine synthase
VIVLGIESSCDETCAAVVKDSSAVLSNVVASSLKSHCLYGGVIPEIASRAHLGSICSVVDVALNEARVNRQDLDLIAVTQGPGLIGSLLVGISFARGLSMGWKLPLMFVDHVRAHLYAAFIEHRDVSFPFVGLVVSGGHTSLYRVNSLSYEELIGSTRDDAAGEAFDKVAKILELGYPGGPVIERTAQKGDASAFAFHCGCGPGLDFSFSGIKTAVLYKALELKKIYGKISEDMKADICASFQKAVVNDLVNKAVLAVERADAKALVVGGGVVSNNILRDSLAAASRKHGFELYLACKEYCLDNAAMVASFGGRLFKSRMAGKIRRACYDHGL